MTGVWLTGLIAWVASATGSLEYAGPTTGPALPTTRPARGEQLNAALVNMPANTWVHLKPDRNPVGRSYSGIGGAIGAGYIFYFGGGHGSHPGNDVELYHIATSAWTRATEPESWKDADTWTHLTPEEREKVKGIGGGWGVGYLSPKGRPLTEHTYQDTCYDPEGKRFISVLASGTWAFDPAKRAWSLLAGRSAPDKGFHPPRGATAAQLVLYDPGLKKVLYIVGGGVYAVFLFDPATNRWERKTDQRVLHGVEMYGVYVPDVKAHLILQTDDYSKSPGLRWFDAASLTFRDAAPMPAEMAKRNTSLAYDPEHKVVVFVQRPYFTAGSVAVWTYAPLENSWTKLALEGQPPRGTTAWNQLVYDPDHKCFLFLNVLTVGSGGVGGTTDGLYAFRLKGRQQE